MDRREFLRHSGAFVTLALVAASCGGKTVDDTVDTSDDTESDTDTDTDTDSDTDSDTDTDTDSDTDTDTTAACDVCDDGDAEGPADRHGHYICVPVADFTSGSDHTYTSTGGTHTHQVPLTSAQLQSIGTGQTVVVNTTVPHAHTWTIAICG